MTPLFTMRAAIEDEALLGSAFSKPNQGSWAAWRSLAIALRGEQLTEEETAIFAKLTGGLKPPTAPAEEVAIIKGRRSGGTSALAVLAVYLASLIDYSDVLGVGERGTLLFAAPTQKQATVAFGRASGIIDASPFLSRMVTNRTQDSISLSNGVDLEIRPASWRYVRSLTLVGAVIDESAFLAYEDAAASDVELVAAIRPALIATRGPLVIASTPYARKGILHDAYQKHYGKPDQPILVIKATSKQTNPTLPQAFIDKELARDPAKARAEYLGEFRKDVSGFLSRELLEEAVD